MSVERKVKKSKVFRRYTKRSQFIWRDWFWVLINEIKKAIRLLTLSEARTDEFVDKVAKIKLDKISSSLYFMG